ncbi:GTPase HflX [Laceyella sacchari]|uniref:GTPase HflX n=1 Tax=Laceyella sacchari TaxID=37482 RepID=UPI0035C752C4
METVQNSEKEKAILVGCGPKRNEWELLSTLEELGRLAETSAAEVIGQAVQFRDRLDPAWLIGKGKAEEVAKMAEEREADLVIFDHELSPAQIRNLERLLPCKVIDRTQLILDIFAQRAQTKEGRIQVELAQLEYMLPRLAGRGKELSRLGGGIGTRGPGEKKLETDRRHIHRQIRDLKKQLEEVKKHRRLHSERRKKNEVVQVALVGYTNAGKSTLLNRLTGAEVLAENKLFATLDPTSRMLELPSGQQVILTDTVGFIRNLPHHLVAAFRSTLEQVREADLLLHVVDAAHPEAAEQIAAVEKVLEELQATDIPTLMVLNKADLLDGQGIEPDGREIVRISALREEDLDKLKRKIENLLHSKPMTVHLKIPIERGDLLSALHRMAEVVSAKANDAFMEIECRLTDKQLEKLPSELKQQVT